MTPQTADSRSGAGGTGPKHGGVSTHQSGTRCQTPGSVRYARALVILGRELLGVWVKFQATRVRASPVGVAPTWLA